MNKTMFYENVYLEVEQHRLIHIITRRAGEYKPLN